MGGSRWNGDAWGPNKGWGSNGGRSNGWVNYGASKSEKQLDTQIAKMEKQLSELVKGSPPAAKAGVWEAGNPHLTAWSCQCGFQNFKSRTACMKCKTKQPEPGSGTAAPAGAGVPAEAAGSKPDEELVFWQNQLRSVKASAAGPGKTQLLELAEGKIQELTKQVRACRPLPARFQAAEARVQEAAKGAKVALEAALALEKQLRAAFELVKAADTRLEEATCDLAATKRELAAPVAPPAAADQAAVIQQVLEKLVALGVVQLQGGTPAIFQAAVGEAMQEALQSKAPPTGVEPMPEGMEVDGEAAIAACQGGGPPLPAGPQWEAAAGEEQQQPPQQQQAQQQQQQQPQQQRQQQQQKQQQQGGQGPARAEDGTRDLVAQALEEAARTLPGSPEAPAAYGAVKEEKTGRPDPLGR
jgi:hypothetical protein